MSGFRAHLPARPSAERLAQMETTATTLAKGAAAAGAAALMGQALGFLHDAADVLEEVSELGPDELIGLLTSTGGAVVEDVATDAVADAVADAAVGAGVRFVGDIIDAEFSVVDEGDEGDDEEEAVVPPPRSRQIRLSDFDEDDGGVAPTIPPQRQLPAPAPGRRIKWKRGSR